MPKKKATKKEVVNVWAVVSHFDELEADAYGYVQIFTTRRAAREVAAELGARVVKATVTITK